MILPLAEIAELTALMRRHGVALLELEEGGRLLRLAPGAADAPVQALSPGVGRLETQRAPGIPFASPGEAVAEGQILGLLRAGLVRRPVTAPLAGTLRGALLEEGALAGFGTPLFEITPNPHAAAGAATETT